MGPRTAKDTGLYGLCSHNECKERRKPYPLPESGDTYHDQPHSAACRHRSSRKASAWFNGFVASAGLRHEITHHVIASNLGSGALIGYELREVAETSPVQEVDRSEEFPGKPRSLDSKRTHAVTWTKLPKSVNLGNLFPYEEKSIDHQWRISPNLRPYPVNWCFEGNG